MKYRNIRKPLVIGTAVLFHVLLLFHLLFSPVIIVMASFKGILNASFFAFITIFLLSLFFGRAYCSWFCPGCGVQEVLSVVVRKKSKNSKALRIKYLIFALWISAIVAGYLINGFLKTDLSFGMTDIVPERKIILTVGAFIIIAPLTILAGRFASCKYICWQAPFMIAGTRIRNRLKLPGLRLGFSPEKCTECNLCTKSCPMNIDVMEMAGSSKKTHTECLLCGTCVDACNKKAIRFTFSVPKG